MALAKIGEYIEIDEFTVAPVIGYKSTGGNVRDGFIYHAAHQKDGKWFISHPTDDHGVDIEVEQSTVTEMFDVLKSKDI